MKRLKLLPMSILPVSSKNVEKLVYTQILNLKKYNLLTNIALDQQYQLLR